MTTQVHSLPHDHVRLPPLTHWPWQVKKVPRLLREDRWRRKALVCRGQGSHISCKTSRFWKESWMDGNCVGPSTQIMHDYRNPFWYSGCSAKHLQFGYLAIFEMFSAVLDVVVVVVFPLSAGTCIIPRICITCSGFKVLCSVFFRIYWPVLRQACKNGYNNNNGYLEYITCPGGRH